jgi:hypothetical protein
VRSWATICSDEHRPIDRGKDEENRRGKDEENHCQAWVAEQAGACRHQHDQCGGTMMIQSYG